MLIYQIPQTAGSRQQFLDAIANNEMKIKVEEKDESKLMEGFQKIANRITMGLGIAALIAAGAGP